MLPYVLAWVVGLGSLAIYLAAFFFPEIHRKHDFIWSGVGLFYALILWIYSDRLTGGLLLGETAGVALLCWLGWQTLVLRRQQIPAEQQTQLPDTTALQERMSSMTRQLQERLGALSRTPTLPEKPVSSAAKTEEVLEVAEEIAEIEEKLDAAVAESIAAAQAEASASTPEADMVVPPPIAAEIEQSLPEPQAVQPQASQGKPSPPASKPLDLSQLGGRASQAFGTVKETLQGIPKLLKPKSKSKPVWVRPPADQPAESSTDQEAAPDSPVLAVEEKVAEAPEPLEVPQEITEGAISEAEVPTLHQSSVDELPSPKAEVEREPGVVTTPESADTPTVVAEQQAIAASEAAVTELSDAASPQPGKQPPSEADVLEEPGEQAQEAEPPT